MDLSTVATGAFTPTEFHARLARMVGAWKGTAKTYADPSDPTAAESAPFEGEIATLLGGRFLRLSYVTHAFGQPIAGELTIAYEDGDRRFRMSWIDSMHTSSCILVSDTKPVSEATISAFTTYFAGEGQPRWGWRTELDDRTAGALRIRMFNIQPGEDEQLGVEIELAR